MIEKIYLFLLTNSPKFCGGVRWVDGLLHKYSVKFDLYLVFTCNMNTKKNKIRRLLVDKRNQVLSRIVFPQPEHLLFLCSMCYCLPYLIPPKDISGFEALFANCYGQLGSHTHIRLLMSQTAHEWLRSS
jgi:hypothetical protein